MVSPVLCSLRKEAVHIGEPDNSNDGTAQCNHHFFLKGKWKQIVRQLNFTVSIQSSLGFVVKGWRKCLGIEERKVREVYCVDLGEGKGNKAYLLFSSSL